MKLWQMRPCPVPLLKLMALSVIHLQPLRLVLLDNLMRDFMTLVDSYLNSSHYEPDEVQHVTMVSPLQILTQKLCEFLTVISQIWHSSISVTLIKRL